MMSGGPRFQASIPKQMVEFPKTENKAAEDVKRTYD